MNILVLTPLVPYPPHDGDKLRLYYFLKGLKAKGHTIDLFCLTRVKEDLAQAEFLRPLCRRLYLEHLPNRELFFNLVGGFLAGHSMNVSSYFSPRLRDSLISYWATREGASVDVVLAHRLRMAPAAFEGNPGKPVVVDLTDCLTAYASQLKKETDVPLSRKLHALWDYSFIRKDEEDWTKHSTFSTVISESDAQALRELGAPPDKIQVIPNGVSFEATAAPRPAIYLKGSPVVCFVGNMGYAPNEAGALWFLRHVWPEVKRRVPTAIFAAVGGQPRKILRDFDNGGDIRITGWVPQVEPYLKHADLSIAPLKVSAGMQNKVALSMALGIPVVATPGAASWLPPKGRGGLRVAEDAGIFIEEVTQALLKPSAARSRARWGRAYILRHFRWADSVKRLEQVLKQAVKPSHSHR